MAELEYILGHSLCRDPRASLERVWSFLGLPAPAIATVGELKAMRAAVGTVRCSCGASLHRCRFWGRVRQEVEARCAPFDVDDLGTRFDWPERRWLDRVLRARIGGVTRDGRGTALSAMRHDGIPMHRAATEYRRTHDECRRLVCRLGAAASTVLRYEDLCRDPRASLERVWSFLGLPADAASLDLRPAARHVLGNDMRLREDIEIRLDERWKSDLASTDLATFERIDGGANRALGYA